MNTDRHIIMRQIMELEAPSREAAVDLQQRVGAFCRNVMPALLDRICTRCDGGDRVFRIDRLEIDLGRISAMQLEEKISERTAKILLEALGEKVDRLRLRQDSGSAAGQPHPSIRGSPEPAAAVSGDRMLSPADDDLELILYFLDTGFLPWSTVAGAVEPLEETLQKLTQTAPDKIDAILKFVAARPVARRRLITQFDHDVLWLLVRRGSPDGGARLRRWGHDFEAAVAAADFERTVETELRKSFWDSAFQNLAALSEKGFTSAAFWQQAVLRAVGQSRLGAEKLLTALIKGARQAGGSSVALQSNLAVTLEQLTERSGFGQYRPRSASGATLTSVRHTEKQISANTSDIVPRPEAMTHPVSAAEQKPTVDRQEKKNPRRAESQDLQDEVADSHSVKVAPQEQAPGEDLKDDSGTLSKAQDSRATPHPQGDAPNDREHAEIPFRRAGQANGSAPDKGYLTDRKYPEIRFDIKPEQDVGTAPELATGAGDPPLAVKQPPSADQRPPSHRPEGTVSSAPDGEQEEQLKRSDVPDSGPEDTNLIIPIQSGSSAGDFSPDAHSELPARAVEGLESKPKSAASYRSRLKHPETTLSAAISTSEKATPAYLSGIDADTALQEIYVDNAGLVIVWPFLPPFFKTLELMEKDDFIDDRSKARAIYILQYLVTGKEEFPEYVLPLNKLLCGWEIGEPIGREYRLTDLEKSESQKLLEAVISHWAALKQTSVEGLRTSFLQRNAVLIETMRHWLLRVERKPHDMLIEHLPWCISMIHLSWVKKMLTVEW